MIKKITLILILITQVTIGVYAQDQSEKDSLLKTSYLDRFGKDDTSRALIKFYVDNHAVFSKMSKNFGIADIAMISGAALMNKSYSNNTFNKIVFWYFAGSAIVYTGGFIYSVVQANKYNEKHLMKALESYQKHQFDSRKLLNKKSGFKKYLENEQE